MKNFVIGIVSLVAMVVLTSPAFGALASVTFDDSVTSNSGIWMYTEGGNDPALIGQVNDWLDSNGHTLVSDFSVYEKVPEDGDFPGGEVGKSGTWETDSPINFYSLKGGNGYAMFWVNPASNEGTFTTIGPFNSANNTGFLLNNGGNPPDLSHITFYTANPVPIPAAAWLLGSGMLGLLVVRRRRSS